MNNNRPTPFLQYQRNGMIDRQRRKMLTALSAGAWLTACGGGGGNATAQAKTARESAAAALTDATTTTSGGFALPEVAGGVSWQRYDVAPFPASIMAPYPYGGTKHTRWARRTVDGCWYVLGGDYSQPGLNVGGSASNLMWKVTPGEPFPSWTQLNSYVPAPGHKIPAHVDEAPFIYDSKRDRFFLFPYARWANLGAESPDVIVGHAMLYHPATNTWEDLWSGTYVDDHNPKQLDPNGHEYPLSTAKWGFYDEATDKFYIPQGDSSLMVIDAGTLAMEWPIAGIGNKSPYDLYNGTFYSACPLFDRKRRRIVAIKPMVRDPQYADPNGMKLICVDIDINPRTGTRDVYVLPQTNAAFDTANELDIDTECLVHDEANDLYVLYGGGIKPDNQISQDIATNDFRVIPASGGTWKKLLPATATVPPQRFAQTMHWEPRVGKFFMLGGITDASTDAKPEVFFPVVNASAIVARPAWRTSMAANTWTAVPATNTLAAVDPEKNPAVNPNGTSNAPWHSVGGQHTIVDAWNGACYDDLTHTFFIGPAGGHADYGGNERYRIKLGAAAPAWEMYGKPSGAIGNLIDWSNPNDDTTGTFSDGVPRSVHTYNYPVFVPNYGQVLARLTALYASGHDLKKAFRIDPVSGATSLLKDYSTAPNAGGTTSVGAACYDETRHCIWMLHTGGSALQRLDILTGTVTQCGTADNRAAGNNAIYFLPEWDALLCISRSNPAATPTMPDVGINTGLSIINLTARPGRPAFTQTGLAISGSFAAGFGCWDAARSGSQAFYEGVIGGDTGAIGAFWDERRHRLVMWGNETNTAQLSTLTPGADPFTGPWTAGAIALGSGNAVTPSVQVRNGTYGRFAYSPSYDGVFLLNSVNGPLYFYAFS
jgi:hypothetical protein